MPSPRQMAAMESFQSSSSPSQSQMSTGPVRMAAQPGMADTPVWTPTAMADANTLDLNATGCSLFVIASLDTYGAATGSVRKGAFVEKSGVGGISYSLETRDEVGENPPAVLAGLAYQNGAVSRSSSNVVALSRFTILSVVAGPNSPTGAGLYVDGTLRGSVSGSVGADNANALIIGGAAGRWVNGRVAEIVLYKGVLSVADRQRVEGYLANRYGTTIFLPADHPYRNTAPTV